MLFVAFEGMRGTVPFFAEAAEITIKADPNDLRKAEINGSAIHERYMAFNEKFEEFDENIYQQYKAYQAAEEVANEEAMKAAEAAYEEAEKEKNNIWLNTSEPTTKTLFRSTSAIATVISLSWMNSNRW